MVSNVHAVLQKLRWIPAVCASVMLLLASGQVPGLASIQLPWESFIPLMQWTVFLSAIWLGYVHWKAATAMASPQRRLLVVLLLIIAALFNPFAAVPLNRSLWVPIDLGAAIVFLATLKLKVQVDHSR